MHCWNNLQTSYKKSVWTGSLAILSISMVHETLCDIVWHNETLCDNGRCCVTLWNIETCLKTFYDIVKTSLAKTLLRHFTLNFCVVLSGIDKTFWAMRMIIWATNGKWDFSDSFRHVSKTIRQVRHCETTHDIVAWHVRRSVTCGDILWHLIRKSKFVLSNPAAVGSCWPEKHCRMLFLNQAWRVCAPKTKDPRSVIRSIFERL